MKTDGVDLGAAIIPIRADLHIIRMWQSQLNFRSNKINDFEAQMLEMTKNTPKIDVIVAENEKLKAEVDHMNVKLNGLEQISEINKLEIVGVPERDNEILIKIFQLGSADIDSLHRVPSNENQSDKTHDY